MINLSNSMMLSADKFMRVERVVSFSKDKRSIDDTEDSVCRITCKQCPKAYIGESGRKLSIRVSEHKKDVESTTASSLERRKSPLS